MKKIILLGSAVVLLGMMSCKKNYTCVCTTTDTATSTSIGTTKTTIKDTKKKAKDTCEGASASAGTLTTTCVIQ